MKKVVIFSAFYYNSKITEQNSCQFAICYLSFFQTLTFLYFLGPSTWPHQLHLRRRLVVFIKTPKVQKHEHWGTSNVAHILNKSTVSVSWFRYWQKSILMLRFVLRQKSNVSISILFCLRNCTSSDHFGRVTSEQKGWIIVWPHTYIC